MAKKKTISLISSILLLGGLFSFATISNKEQVQVVKADYATTRLTGLFEKITDPSQIEKGKTQVVIVTSRGWVFNGIGGNPAYAHAEGGGVTMFGNYNTATGEVEDDSRFLYLNNKAAQILTAVDGSSSYDSSYFSFTSDFYIGGIKYNHYLGENDEENDPGRNDYKSIGWFMDGFGIRPTKDGKSTWELQYDSDLGYMKMRKVIYDDTTSFLCYNHSGARNRFNFGGIDRVNINLYRPVETFERTLLPNPVSEPDRQTYSKGETLEYEGLQVGVKVNGNDYVIKYDWKTCGFFSTPPVLTTVGENIPVTIQAFGFNYILAITVTTNASGNRYYLTNIVPADRRGTYLISTENSRVLDASRSAGSTMNYKSMDSEIFNNGYIDANSEDLDESIFKIVRTNISGSWYYHAVNYLGQYLTVGEKFDETYDECYLDYSDEATVNNAVTMSNNSLVINGYYLSESYAKQKLICLTKEYSPMHLFKLSSSTSSVSSQVSDYISFFINRTEEVCKVEDGGDFEKITDDLWNELKVEFNKLGCDAQGLFASATYTHNAEEKYTKANIADRYDYIVSKYDKEDFMLRKLSNTYESHFSNSSISMLFEGDNSIASILLIAITTSVSSLALVLLIRKKRRYTK